MFCTGALSVLLACAFLPQTGLLLPFAAIFVAICALILLRGGPARGYALCLLLGAAAALALMAATNRRLYAVQQKYAGREVYLRAEVESTSASFYSGAVNAVLLVAEAGGEAARFRCEGVALPECAAGETIEGLFKLEAPTAADRLDRCADGIALEAECAGQFKCTGQSVSFRAVTARVQQAMSRALRRSLDENTGGVLAAMVLGDRNALPKEMNSAYRAAGLSHVLVVSGMHVSILCGDIFSRLPHRTKKERGYAAKRARALWDAVLAVGLCGVTGFTPSVMRAAVAVWISALGVWVWGEPDALTSLAAAGFLMSVPNAYAACDVGFELSFAAVLGTLAGAEAARRGRAAFAARRRKHGGHAAPSLPARAAAGFGGWLWDTVCVSACASAGTFPVLVLRGLSASLYALVSSVAVLWVVDPIMYLGLAAAFVGLLPFAQPLYTALALGAGVLTRALNAWAVMAAGWPGAQIYFDTIYAAIVCLALVGLSLLAAHWRVKLRLAVPAVALCAAVAVTAGNALNRGVVRVELVGSSTAPAAVITQNGSAVVLLRGGAATQRAVIELLARRGVAEADLLVDMRLAPETECAVPAKQTRPAAKQPAYTAQTAALPYVDLEIYRTSSGCAVLAEIDGRRFVTLSGTVELAKTVRADWLLASMSNPSAFSCENILSLSSSYRWLGEGASPAGSRLVLRPGGGERVF